MSTVESRGMTASTNAINKKIFKTKLSKTTQRMLLTVFQSIERDYGIPLEELTGKFGIPRIIKPSCRKEGSCNFITKEGRPCKLKAKCNGLCHKHEKSADKLKELETFFRKRFEEESDSVCEGIDFKRLTL